MRLFWVMIHRVIVVDYIDIIICAMMTEQVLHEALLFGCDLVTWVVVRVI